MKNVFHPRYRKVSLFHLASFVAVLLLTSHNSISQSKVESNRYEASREFIPASPAASMFSIFGHTPISHFTGAPQIEVPLHQVVYRDLNLDLNLLYHSSMGNRPDAIPGPVGNGWLFTSGGVITRISKGVRPVDFPNPATVPIGYNPTASGTWSSNASLQTYISNAKVFVDPDCRYDEFAYNFCGLSGKFYTDHNGIKHFKTAQGESLTLQTFTHSQRMVPIPSETQGSPGGYSIGEEYRPSISQKNYIFHFRITDSRGVKYTFGLVDEAVEFSRPGMAATGDPDYLEQNTIPTTWHLTSIESPNGYSITLNYRRGKFYVTSESYCDGMIMSHSNISGLNVPATAKAIKSTIIHPSYLESISTPNSTVNFYWNIASQQLKYRYNPSPTVTDPYFPMYFMKYVDIKDALMENRFPEKLDSFKVFVNQQLKKVVKFNYTSDTSTRLKLLSVKVCGNDPTKNAHDLWQFQYNNTPLPDYLAFKSDKYGFYNGRNDYITSNDPSYYSGLFGNSSNLADYLNSREPNSNYSRAEILTKVFYPTGGYSEFEYENNDYGRKAIFWPVGIAENSGSLSKITGGLRIRKITTYDAVNHKAGEKRYIYKKGFASGGQSSSGVLSYEPIFQETFSGLVSAPANKSGSASQYEGSLTYRRWSTDPIYPASYNKGTHVTYSEVTEMSLDGSYTVYKYNNYDNGFHDKPAENMVCDNSNVAAFYREDDMNNMELERGNLQAELSYTNTNQLVRKIEYLYDTSAARFSNNVRVLKAIPNPIFSGNFPSLRYTATLQYTYFPYLLQKRQVDYTASNDSLVNVEDYAYDISNRLLKEKSIVLSNNRKKRILNRYTDDMIAIGQTTPYAAMKSKHIVNALVETEERLDTTLLMITATPYVAGLSPNSNLFTPALSKSQYKYSSPETRVTYHRYDAVGNLLYQSRDGVSRVCYLWSYDRLYPIAKIVNASYDTVQAILTANSIDSFSLLPSPSLSNVNAFVNRLRSSPRMSKAMITSYSYDLLFGLASETDVNGKTTYYEYDHMGRLKVIKDKDMNIIKLICYDYAGQATDCSIQRLQGTKQLYLADNISDICGPFSNPPTVLIPVTAHFQSQIQGIDTGDMVYYSDIQYSNPLPAGYYKDPSIPPFGSVSYHYLVNGKIVYTASCDGPQPFTTRYRSTLGSNMCSTLLPLRSIFSLYQDPFSINAYWFSDQGMTVYVENGYYSYGDKYYQILNGKVVSIQFCQPPSSKVLQRDPYFQQVCSANNIITYTAYYRGAFDVGTVLYTNSSQTTTLGTGHYSDGTTVITVNSSGSIIRKMTCSAAAGLPPAQVPGPIF